MTPESISSSTDPTVRKEDLRNRIIERARVGVTVALHRMDAVLARMRDEGSGNELSDEEERDGGSIEDAQAWLDFKKESDALEAEIERKKWEDVTTFSNRIRASKEKP